MSGASWKHGEVLAWTQGDGPGRPPRGPGRVLPVALAGALAVVFAGILSTDSLCPEHRAWVLSLATAAFSGSVLAIVGLLRGWAIAPVLTLGVAAAGVACGLIDAAHSPTRGRLIAAGFAVVCLGAAFLAMRSLTLRRWDRSVADSLRPVEVDPAGIPAGADQAAGQPDSRPSPPDRTFADT